MQHSENWAGLAPISKISDGTSEKNLKGVNTVPYRGFGGGFGFGTPVRS